jgi:DNA helicase HerA-like ATPase
MKTQLTLGYCARRRPVGVPFKVLNRHGYIVGATGTGKTVTLQVFAEQLSLAGVSVFLPDVKGDLTGMMHASTDARMAQRASDLGAPQYTPTKLPVVFWDIFGKQGLPFRVSVSSTGANLLSRLFSLSEVQKSIMSIAFIIADRKNIPLHSLEDLRTIMRFMYNNHRPLSAEFGALSQSSIATILRKLVDATESIDTGLSAFFSRDETFLPENLISVNPLGRVNILAAEKLVDQQTLYGVVMVKLLETLYRELPESGDLQKPKIVVIIDETHLLFKEAPSYVLASVEKVTRLIRSKGVGVYFVSQNPTDIPESVSKNLGNKVFHALRPSSPRDFRYIENTMQMFQGADATAVTRLQIGEVFASFLSETGAARPLEKLYVRPPTTKLGPALTDEIVKTVEQHKKGNIMKVKSPAEYVAKTAEQAFIEIAKKQSQSRFTKILDSLKKNM